jgi:recombination protein RecR
MQHAAPLAKLIEALRALPGVGPKTAQRMAFHLLQGGRGGARTLAEALTTGLASIGRCKRCRMLTDTELCSICAAPGRDTALLCVVESPADVVAVEQSGGYRGKYFVLHGHLSPLDGVGPEQIGARDFEALIDSGEVLEVILATNPTVEGEATAHFLGERAAARGIQASRIAHGVPIGGELEYVDGGTLAHAFAGRVSQR